MENNEIFQENWQETGSNKKKYTSVWCGLELWEQKLRKECRTGTPTKNVKDTKRTARGRPMSRQGQARVCKHGEAGIVKLGGSEQWETLNGSLDAAQWTESQQGGQG